MGKHGVACVAYMSPNFHLVTGAFAPISLTAKDPSPKRPASMAELINTDP